MLDLSGLEPLVSSTLPWNRPSQATHVRSQPPTASSFAMAAAVASPPATEVDQLTRIRLELATLDQIRSARLRIHSISSRFYFRSNCPANQPCSSGNFLFSMSRGCYVRELRFRSVVLQRHRCCVVYGAVVCLHWQS